MSQGLRNLTPQQRAELKAALLERYRMRTQYTLKALVRRFGVHIDAIRRFEQREGLRE